MEPKSTKNQPKVNQKSTKSQPKVNQKQPKATLSNQK